MTTNVTLHAGRDVAYFTHGQEGRHGGTQVARPDRAGRRRGARAAVHEGHRLGRPDPRRQAAAERRRGPREAAVAAYRPGKRNDAAAIRLRTRL